MWSCAYSWKGEHFAAFDQTHICPVIVSLCTDVISDSIDFDSITKHITGRIAMQTISVRPFFRYLAICSINWHAWANTYEMSSNPTHLKTLLDNLYAWACKRTRNTEQRCMLNTDKWIMCTYICITGSLCVRRAVNSGSECNMTVQDGEPLYIFACVYANETRAKRPINRCTQWTESALEILSGDHANQLLYIG